MNWYESLLVVVGISLDIFAVMEVQGAMLAEVKRRTLITACAVVTGLQLAFFFGGYALCYLLTTYGYFTNSLKNGSLVAAFVFAGLGIRLLYKGLKTEQIDESRSELIVRKYIGIVVLVSTYSIFAGCALGMIGSSPLHIFVMLVICSVVMVAAGLYTGYRFGFELKSKVYIIGAIFLFVACADILLGNVFGIIGA